MAKGRRDNVQMPHFRVFSGERTDSPTEGNVSRFEEFVNFDATVEAETGTVNAVSPQGYEMLTTAPTQINPDGDARLSDEDENPYFGKVSLMVGSFGKGNVFWTVHNGGDDTYTGYGYEYGYDSNGDLRVDLAVEGRGGEILSLAQETWDKPAVAVVRRAAALDAPEPEPEPEPVGDVVLEFFGPRGYLMGASFDVYVPVTLQEAVTVTNGSSVVLAPATAIAGVAVTGQVEAGDTIGNYVGTKNSPYALVPRELYSMFKITNNLEEEINWQIRRVVDPANVVPDEAFVQEITLAGDFNIVPGFTSGADDFGGVQTGGNWDEFYPDESYYFEDYIPAESFMCIAFESGIFLSTPITATGSNPVWPPGYGGDPASYPSHFFYTYEFDWWTTASPEMITTIRFTVQLFAGTSAP